MSNDKITLSQGQQEALDKIENFLKDSHVKVFILKGFAGTGKTTLIKSIVKLLNSCKLQFKLLASTGRAAKVLADATGIIATTIHSEIYSLLGLYGDTDSVTEQSSDLNLFSDLQLYLQFHLKDLTHNTPDIYIIDEASMIGDTSSNNAYQAKFGSGELLTDFINYSQGSKLLFVGDPCQLPPVSGTFSPALSSTYISQNFDLSCTEASLTKIMRQAGNNGIIDASGKVRHLWENAPENKFAYTGNHWLKLPFRDIDDIILLDRESDLKHMYLNDISGGNYTHAAFICRSNRACNSYSAEFREALGYSGNLCPGELLLVMQNNLISGYRNGDLLVVEEVSNVSETRADLSFRKIKVKELYTGFEYTQLLIEDLLYQSQPQLNPDQQKKLFIDFILRMRKEGIDKNNREKFNQAMEKDIYLNALRTSFGYALTCHKAQGGEWKHVYASFPRNIMLNPTKENYQWVYTAMTRASEKFFLLDDIYIEDFYGFGHKYFRS